MDGCPQGGVVCCFVALACAIAYSGNEPSLRGSEVTEAIQTRQSVRTQLMLVRLGSPSGPSQRWYARQSVRTQPTLVHRHNVPG